MKKTVDYCRANKYYRDVLISINVLICLLCRMNTATDGIEQDNQFWMLLS